MYLWNVDALKQQLKAAQVSEVDQFRYALGYITVAALAEVLPNPIADFNVWDAFESIAYVLATSVGTIYCYRANGGRYGQRFLERYFGLAWVVGIRFAVQTFVPLLVLFLVGMYFFGVQAEVGSPYRTAFLLIITMEFYRRLARDIRDVSKGGPV